MDLPAFGSDPIDTYSTPIKVEDTKLSKIFIMAVRENAEKPGRALAAVWDIRVPLLPQFINNYSYTVTFKYAGNIAGNHYHKIKQELLYPISGNMTVGFEDINSKIKEEIKLETDKHQVLYIPTNIAHAIRSDSETAIFLVLASRPGVESDEIPYKVL